MHVVVKIVYLKNNSKNIEKKVSAKIFKKTTTRTLKKLHY